MGSFMILPLACLVVLAFLPGTYAFGAGKDIGRTIPEFPLMLAIIHQETSRDMLILRVGHPAA